MPRQFTRGNDVTVQIELWEVSARNDGPIAFQPRTHQIRATKLLELRHVGRSEVAVFGAGGNVHALEARLRISDRFPALRRRVDVARPNPLMPRGPASRRQSRCIVSSAGHRKSRIILHAVSPMVRIADHRGYENYHHQEDRSGEGDCVAEKANKCCHVIKSSGYRLFIVTAKAVLSMHPDALVSEAARGNVKCK